MKKMLDFLVCPFDKESELELFEFVARKNTKDQGFNNDLDNDVIIEEGILFCNNCSRFYPIVEEIPILLPDNLREKNKDLEILMRWADHLPEKVTKNAVPWHI